MTNSTTFPGTVTATTFVGSGASLTSIPLGQVTGSFSGNTAFDTTTLVVDGTNNRVGVGTTTPQKTLEVAGPMRITDGLSNVCDLSVVNVEAGWDAGTKIQASDKQQSDYFGWSVSMSSDGTRVIVGAYSEDTGGDATGAAYIFALSGGSWSQEAKIQSSDIQASDYFGYRVSMSGDGTKVIVGANQESTGATYAGAAYIFAYSSGSWSQEAKIQASDKQADDEFGQSVSMSSDGTKVIVGAWQEDTGGSNAGAAYIFALSGGSWDTGTKIQASDKQDSDRFGYKVSMNSDGTKVIVGAWQDDTGGSNAGAAYIFALSGGSWSQQAKIQASDKQAHDRFGRSVSMNSDGTKVIVGAWQDDTGGSNAGAAYIFALSGGSWSQQAKIQASDKQAHDYFGYSVSMSSDGTKVIVGAFAEDTGGGSAGSAYIFALSGGSWSQQAKIQASDPEANDRFGRSVSMNSDGTKVIVGAWLEDTGGTNAGAAYIFAYSSGSWSQQQKIQASDKQADDYFGQSVSMSGDGTKVIVGADREDTGATNAGAAYIFESPLINTLTSSTVISAAGTTLSFTGQHICVPEGPMSPGLVVSANKNRYVSLNGTLTTGMGAIRSSESLPVVSLSNVVSDRSVFGVVDRLEQGGTTERRQVLGATVVTAQKELGDTRVIVNSLGEGAIWVADTNGPLVSGDYITTSHLTGYGQKQDDDILHNSTVAKITMDCDFNPDDVPIQVIKKNDTGDNDLDTYGHIQWEDHPSKTAQKAYTIRYLTVDGNRTDEANAVHRTAFVGCTYHCG
jgi:hypothetical protein